MQTSFDLLLYHRLLTFGTEGNAMPAGIVPAAAIAPCWPPTGGAAAGGAAAGTVAFAPGAAGGGAIAPVGGTALSGIAPIHMSAF